MVQEGRTQMQTSQKQKVYFQNDELEQKQKARTKSAAEPVIKNT